jgi:hypothetical protein
LVRQGHYADDGFDLAPLEGARRDRVTEPVFRRTEYLEDASLVGRRQGLVTDRAVVVEFDRIVVRPLLVHPREKCARDLLTDRRQVVPLVALRDELSAELVEVVVELPGVPEPDPFSQFRKGEFDGRFRRRTVFRERTEDLHPDPPIERLEGVRSHGAAVGRRRQKPIGAATRRSSTGRWRPERRARRFH